MQCSFIAIDLWLSEIEQKIGQSLENRLNHRKPTRRAYADHWQKETNSAYFFFVYSKTSNIHLSNHYHCIA